MHVVRCKQKNLWGVRVAVAWGLDVYFTVGQDGWAADAGNPDQVWVVNDFAGCSADVQEAPIEDVEVDGYDFVPCCFLRSG